MKTGNTQHIEIIAWHGWGFGSTFWDAWKTETPKSVKIKAADRGYFYDKKTPLFSSGDSLKMLMAHSYGIHLCSQKNIEAADIVVVINGFENFHPKAGDEKEQSTRLLNRMIQKFREQPANVLKKFWENTFYPAEEVPYSHEHDFDKELLLEDLINLSESRFDFHKLANGNPIISIDGGNDKILGAPRGKAFTRLSERNAVYHFMKEAGHALPLTHLQDCWSFINAMIPIFSNHERYRTTKEAQRH